MNATAFTIAKAAEAAAVGVETIRYYERRGLVAQPEHKPGGFRNYDRGHVARIRFIKRAQELGFSLHEIEGLLALEDGANRAEVRRIAAARLAEIRSRLKDLRRMEGALAKLVARCRHGAAAKCPIIEAIAIGAPSSRRAAPRTRVRAASARKPAMPVPNPQS
ncbi:MAG: MerR family DNA-binding protein [Burkholderiales bacterium]|nr:MerR family DNA-binding protein [Burkholderiales bacterium]